MHEAEMKADVYKSKQTVGLEFEPMTCRCRSSEDPSVLRHQLLQNLNMKYITNSGEASPRSNVHHLLAIANVSLRDSWRLVVQKGSLRSRPLP